MESNWKELAHALGISDKDIENINVGYTEDHQKVYHSLAKWEAANRETNLEDTWKTLKRVLQNAGRNDLITNAEK